MNACHVTHIALAIYVLVLFQISFISTILTFSTGERTATKLLSIVRSPCHNGPLCNTKSRQYGYDANIRAHDNRA